MTSEIKNPKTLRISLPSRPSEVINVSPLTPTEPSNDPATTSTTTTTKRQSHHRRRSSVSTHRESAEMMQVAQASLPPSHHSPDADRNLALLALEGKVASTRAPVQVEIPDFKSPPLDDRTFDFGTAAAGLETCEKRPVITPMVPLGAIASSGGPVGKRDSFGKLIMGASISLKKELGTLVEEDEEEEEATQDSEEEQEEQTVLILAQGAAAPAVPTTISKAPSLRPLSLLAPPSNTPLPLTPSPTPSPRLKSLTLAALAATTLAEGSMSTTNTRSSADKSPRLSAIMYRSSSMGPGGFPITPISRPSSVSSHSSRPASVSSIHSHSSGSSSRDSFHRPERDSLQVPAPAVPISGSGSGSSLHNDPPRPDSQSSHASLVFPGTPQSMDQALPLSPRDATVFTISGSAGGLSSRASSGLSLANVANGLREPMLSPTDQTYLVQSNASLLARVAELESALESHLSTPTNSGMLPGDEHDVTTSPQTDMTEQITMLESERDALKSELEDLQTERDDLAQDIDLWRVRCNDLQARIDKRSGVDPSVWEVEKSVLEGMLTALREGMVRSEIARKNVETELTNVKMELARVQAELAAASANQLEDAPPADADLAQIYTELLKTRSDLADAKAELLESTERMDAVTAESSEQAKELDGAKKELESIKKELERERRLRRDLELQLGAQRQLEARPPQHRATSPNPAAFPRTGSPNPSLIGRSNSPNPSLIARSNSPNALARSSSPTFYARMSVNVPGSVARAVSPALRSVSPIPPSDLARVAFSPSRHLTASMDSQLTEVDERSVDPLALFKAQAKLGDDDEDSMGLFSFGGKDSFVSRAKAVDVDDLFSPAVGLKEVKQETASDSPALGHLSMASEGQELLLAEQIPAMNHADADAGEEDPLEHYESSEEELDAAAAADDTISSAGSWARAVAHSKPATKPAPSSLSAKSAFEDDEEDDSFTPRVSNMPFSAQRQPVARAPGLGGWTFPRANSSASASSSSGGLTSASTASSDALTPTTSDGGVTPTASTTQRSGHHARRSSLTTGWTFPKAGTVQKKKPAPVDRFFSCLDDLDNEDEDLASLPSLPSRISVRGGAVNPKHGFGAMLKASEDDDEDAMPPLPSEGSKMTKSNSNASTLSSTSSTSIRSAMSGRGSRRTRSSISVVRFMAPTPLPSASSGLVLYPGQDDDHEPPTSAPPTTSSFTSARNKEQAKPYALFAAEEEEEEADNKPFQFPKRDDFANMPWSPKSEQPETEIRDVRSAPPTQTSFFPAPAPKKTLVIPASLPVPPRGGRSRSPSPGPASPTTPSSPNKAMPPSPRGLGLRPGKASLKPLSPPPARRPLKPLVATNVSPPQTAKPTPPSPPRNGPVQTSKALPAPPTKNLPAPPAKTSPSSTTAPAKPGAAGGFKFGGFKFGGSSAAAPAAPVTALPASHTRNDSRVYVGNAHSKRPSKEKASHARTSSRDKAAHARKGSKEKMHARRESKGKVHARINSIVPLGHVRSHSRSPSRVQVHTRADSRTGASSPLRTVAVASTHMRTMSSSSSSVFLPGEPLSAPADVNRFSATATEFVSPFDSMPSPIPVDVSFASQQASLQPSPSTSSTRSFSPQPGMRSTSSTYKSSPLAKVVDADATPRPPHLPPPARRSPPKALRIETTPPPISSTVMVASTSSTRSSSETRPSMESRPSTDSGVSTDSRRSGSIISFAAMSNLMPWSPRVVTLSNPSSPAMEERPSLEE